MNSLETRHLASKLKKMLKGELPSSSNTLYNSWKVYTNRPTPLPGFPHHSLLVGGYNACIYCSFTKCTSSKHEGNYSLRGKSACLGRLDKTVWVPSGEPRHQNARWLRAAVPPHSTRQGRGEGRGRTTASSTSAWTARS